jgi:hypothetical protein
MTNLTVVNPNELNPDTSPPPVVIGEASESPDDSDADDVVDVPQGSKV